MERRKIADYSIEGTLGEGGMGVVYRGRDATLDRPVAIKVIRAKLIGEQGKERFLREARACSKINHPNVITVYAAGEDEECPYLAMEFIDGKTLRKAIDEGPIDWRKASRWMTDLLDALSRLHREGIVHRDLKPENIMITQDGVVKLMDFGLAHLQASTTITEEGTTLGTIPYMSPEQVMGQKADSRSDLFSLASVFHEMITGVHPFRGEHPMAVMYSIRNDTPRALKLSSQELPVGMQAVLDRAFEKEMDKRYQTAEEFRAALLALLPEGIDDRGATLARRGTRTVVVAAVAASAVVAAAAIVFFLSVRNGGNSVKAVNYFKLGETELQNNNLQQAEEWYRRSIAEDFHYAPPWSSLGLIAQFKHRFEVADSCYHQALERSPQYAEAMYNLATLRWDMGDLEGAEHWYNKAIETRPSFSAAYNNLGSLLRQNGNPERARDVITRGLEQNPPEPTRSSLLKHRGLVAYQLGDADSARYYLEKALDGIPDSEKPDIEKILRELQR